MLFTSLIRHPRISPSPTDGLITTCVNCTRYLAILALSWLLSVCQLQHLSMEGQRMFISLSVGCWTVVSHWPSLRLPLPPHYPSLEIVLPAAPLGRQRLVTNHTERRGRAPFTAFIHSFKWCLASSSDEEGGKMRTVTVSTVHTLMQQQLWTSCCVTVNSVSRRPGRCPAAVCH